MSKDPQPPIVDHAIEQPSALTAKNLIEDLRRICKVPIWTQTALVEQHTIRERLLAMLALFFGVVALSLAGVGQFRQACADLGAWCVEARSGTRPDRYSHLCRASRP